MNMEESDQSMLILLSSWEGGWQSINGNRDVYIFQGYDREYYLLAYNYDKEYERGSFSCYKIETEENTCYIRLGMTSSELSEEKYPHTLHITGWGSYMRA